MKILYKNMGFGGGAPKSLLEYAQIALQNEYEVLVLGQYTYEPTFYNEKGIKTLDIKYYIPKKIFTNISILRKYYRILKKEKPDLIQVITSTECMFQRILSILLDIPTIYTVPGAKVSQLFVKVMQNEDILVFSEENRIDLIKFGYKDKNIKVIPNRIKFDTILETDNDFYLNKKGNKINFLFIGRIDSNLQSIKKLVDMVYRLRKENVSVLLTVLGDGKLFDSALKIGNKANSCFNEDIVVFEGFQKDVASYISQADIVFGKGRSIMDAVKHQKISFVVGENMQIYPIKPDTFKTLSDYNFAGRHEETGINYSDILDTINQIKENNVDIKQLITTREMLEDKYDINHASDIILEMYEDKLENHKKNRGIQRIFKSIYILIEIYIRLIIGKIRKRLTRDTI